MELRELTTVFAAVVAPLAPTTPVPTCPDWRVRDLVGHIGQGPRWAASMLRSGAPSPVPDPRDSTPGPPSGWTDWLLAGIDDLLDAVATVGAATTVWTVVGPRPAGWWVRRLRADLVAHLADATLLAGAPYAVADELAADTIGEGLDLLATPGLATFPGDREGTIALLPPAGEGWLITRKAGELTWTPAAGVADTTVTGSVQDLLLVLMRRLPLDRVTVTGDRALVEELLTYSV
jgi:uncharacterized protein (TIGR03083 family)